MTQKSLLAAKLNRLYLLFIFSLRISIAYAEMQQVHFAEISRNIRYEKSAFLPLE